MLEQLVDRLIDHVRAGSPCPELPVAALIAASAAPERDHPYGRRSLGAGVRGEVLLVRWRPGVRCAPHDHGASAGLVFVLRGQLSERHLVLAGGAVEVLGERALPETGAVEIAGGAVHDMIATDDAVSLHVYVPRIARMRVLDQARRRTLIVADDCGAWIPDDPDAIVEEVPW